MCKTEINQSNDMNGMTCPGTGQPTPPELRWQSGRLLTDRSLVRSQVVARSFIFLPAPLGVLEKKALFFFSPHAELRTVPTSGKKENEKKLALFFSES